MLGRSLESLWTARRSSQFILKEISTGCSLEGLMLKLELQYFGHIMQRADSLEKTLMLGRIESKRRRQQQRIWWLNGITDSMDMSLSTLQETVKDRIACCASVHGVIKSWTWLSDWTAITDEHRPKIPYQNTSNLNPTYIKNVIHSDQVGFISRMHGVFNICKSVAELYHIQIEE